MSTNHTTATDRIHLHASSTDGVVKRWIELRDVQVLSAAEAKQLARALFATADEIEFGES